MRKTGTSSRNVSPRSNLYEEGSSTSGPKIPERTELKIFCIVEGEATPFPVKIPSNCSVGELQQAIKARKSNAFKDIDADQLTLKLIPGGTTKKGLETLSEESLVALDELEELSTYFPNGAAKGHIHIIVKLPPQGMYLALDGLIFSN
ncbi:hypothetical protein BCR41DRAFT_188909 [Lobosporangium transversale]|uniref:Crinkler effector protein N-terminal domain-containing protein n=1 Tax=Lobosporangium transversale TaxID=64571 RepID=A0A1Y2GCE3_9FUNG|nr:hypothetical protein BCR41DRAFT_188909 [Lobosporangium transversale]ORZ05137.1 hypothetical protein BCR41DRAFT_188909 [Lobosporangium transversale]|eukprot:XP_021876912.1 hypothetical protein BCR41DRAFT_188909 [Lobosporangium transversale]